VSLAGAITPCSTKADLKARPGRGVTNYRWLQNSFNQPRAYRIVRTEKKLALELSEHFC
jgi:hypothetical protein